MRLLHLTGSAVSGFFADLSETYARDCLDVLSGDPRWSHHVATVAPDGAWRLDGSAPCSVGEALRRIEALDVDLMVPQMFCLPGMTSYRALFDVLGVPYVGNTPTAMALAADKARTRAVVAAAGVSVPRGEVVGPGETTSLGPPVVVKPVDADNSSGVTFVDTSSSLPAALAAAYEHSALALVEEYVPLGREVRCGTVERDGALVGLPLEEYAVTSVRGYDDKITRTASGVSLVAKSGERAWIVEESDPVTEAAWEAARRCHRALGCRDYSLVDLRIDPSGRPWFLEAGLYCSFARQSVIATMAEAAGTPVVELFASMAERAVGRSPTPPVSDAPSLTSDVSDSASSR